MTLKLAGRRRRSHVRNVVHDPALGIFAGLNALPKTWHLKTYSYRTTRAQQVAFFEALQPRLRDAGLLGEQGLNLDFHAIMSYGEDTELDKHYVPRRSQRTRSMLTFIAQDGEEHTIIYANAELTARTQSGEVISFCRFYEKTHGELPKLLVFDGKLTTREHLAELDEMKVGFITLRQRSPKLIAALEELPASAWTKTRLSAAASTNRQLHEDAVTLKGATFRQPAVKGLGRDQPTLILTNRQDLTPKQLIERSPTLGDREPARRTDPRLPPGLALRPGPARRRLRRRAHDPRRHHLPPLRARPAHRPPPPDARHDPRLSDRRHRRAALQRPQHRGRPPRAPTPPRYSTPTTRTAIQVPWWGGRTLSYSFPAR